MKTKTTLSLLLAAALLGMAGYGLYFIGMQRGMGMAPQPPATQSADAAPVAQGAAGPFPQSIAQGEEATRRHIAAGIKAGDLDPITGRTILYYHDPMAPGNKFDKPAKSPFMDMMLVPVYAGAEADQGKVSVSARVQQNLGLRTAPVEEGQLSPQLSAVGSIAFNERDQVVIQARSGGYVEGLHVRATLDRVAKDQALADLYLPEWIAAQEEFLSLRRMQGSDLAPLVDAARQRMLQTGMGETLAALVESSGRIQPRITLRAPIGGVVTELALREGMTVTPGATLFRIAGLGTVWANAEVPESQAAWLRPGNRVQATSPALPGVSFDGRLQALLPEVNPLTRTVKARVELGNAGTRLVPGMFVQMRFAGVSGAKALLVPTEAVIQTGRRMVVMLAEEDGRFRPVDIEIGIESEGRTEVKRGLKLGQRVVVSAQFLIDSEASLKAVESRLSAEPAAKAAEQAPRHQSEARVEAVGRDMLTLSHGPIASLKWGSMTMDFKLPAAGRPALPRSIAPGDRIDFEFFMDAQGLPQITSLKLLAPERKPSATPASGSRP